MNINKKTKLFIILGSFFITNAIVAEFIGAKIFSLENLYDACPDCKGYLVDVIEGKELRVKSLVVT